MLTTMLVGLSRILLAAGVMRALIFAADARREADQAYLPELLARSLRATAAAFNSTAAFPVREAVDAANLWATQTGTVPWTHALHVKHVGSGDGDYSLYVSQAWMLLGPV